MHPSRPRKDAGLGPHRICGAGNLDPTAPYRRCTCVALIALSSSTKSGRRAGGPQEWPAGGPPRHSRTLVIRDSSLHHERHEGHRPPGHRAATGGPAPCAARLRLRLTLPLLLLRRRRCGGCCCCCCGCGCGCGCGDDPAGDEEVCDDHEDEENGHGHAPAAVTAASQNRPQ